MPESIVGGQLLHTETLLIPSTGNCGLGYLGHVGEVEPGDWYRVDERGQDPRQELDCRELKISGHDCFP